MNCHFDLFSDKELSSTTLASRAYLVFEEDIPVEFIRDYSYMLIGDSGVSFDTMGVIRDNETDCFYGILFTKTVKNEKQVKISINFAELDTRLREQNLISNFVQKIINEQFYKHPEINEIYLQWDNNVHRCSYSEVGITEIAKMCADDIIK